MFIIQLLRGLLLLAEIGLAVPVFYLCILSIAAIYGTHRRRAQLRHMSPQVNAHTTHPTECTNFAILVPAHNEERILETLLNSLAALDYPQSRHTVYVVADNCTDGTATLARRQQGVCVYERVDTERRGKGFALNWLIQQLDTDQHIHDAYIILDADSVVQPDFLQPLHRELAKGSRALQACNAVLNVTDSPSTALRWLALTLVNHVRSLGRTSLGGSSTLNGNGMCLSRALLARHPWQAYGQAEDYQYYLTIIEHGERVVYVPEAVVRSQMPQSFAQMRTQDIRWESSSGNQSSWKAALTLLKAGIRNRDGVRMEAVAELLTPPLSQLVCGCLLILVLSPFIWLWPGFIISLLLVASLMVYIGSAFYLLRPPRAVYMALLHAPGFVIWKLWVFFVLRRSKKHTSEWVRTSRA